jgi:NAD(P)-dependent dehydrogenase (short-subunit alcohol dehydrogenase family)
MSDTRIALVTGANQGVGLQVATQLAANGVTVYVGSRNLEHGEGAAADIGPGARAIQIDLRDGASISAAAERIRAEKGRLDLLVNNAGISNTRRASGPSGRTDGKAFMAEVAKASKASTASLEEMRAVWDTNVFGTLAVYQAMLPLLRDGIAPRIVNVSSAVGSLTLNADPSHPFHAGYGPVYPASKTAENAVTLTIMNELESTNIKVNLVSPGFTATNLNAFAGTQSIEDGSREVVRAALLGPDGPTGTFTQWENTPVPW